MSVETLSRAVEQEVALATVREYWLRNPQMRLGQILTRVSRGAPFYLDDAALIERLRAQLAEEDGFDGRG